MLADADEPTAECANALAALTEGNLDHPTRELMWGSPGTLLAALFLHERTARCALGRIVPLRRASGNAARPRRQSHR